MAQFSELRAEAKDILRDARFTTATINTKLNEALGDVAGRVLLPRLETNSTVETTSVNRVGLPSDFHRQLSPWAHSTTHNRRIRVYLSLPQLLSRFSMVDQSGVVVGMARQGGYLYYQRIPSTAETIMVNYFKYPDTMTADSDTPDCLPAHTHSRLLVNYACWQLFTRVEDGIEGEGANTVRYKSNYLEAISDLTYFVGATSDVAVEHVDSLNYDSLVE